MNSRFAFCRGFAGAAVVFVLLTGCSGLKTYPNTHEKNVRIRTDTASSFFEKVRVSVHVHAVDARCQLEYQGTVNLDASPFGVGIPADRPSYLVFNFSSSSFLGSSSSSITQETLLRPRPGVQYDVQLSYRNDIYNVVVQEVVPGRGPREMALVGLGACRAG